MAVLFPVDYLNLRSALIGLKSFTDIRPCGTVIHEDNVINRNDNGKGWSVLKFCRTLLTSAHIPVSEPSCVISDHRSIFEVNILFHDREFLMMDLRSKFPCLIRNVLSCKKTVYPVDLILRIFFKLLVCYRCDL